MVDVYYKKGGDFQNSRVKTSEKLPMKATQHRQKLPKSTLLELQKLKLYNNPRNVSSRKVAESQ